MKKLEIIIRPSKLDEVKNILATMGVQGMTIVDVRGFGRQRGYKEVYHGVTVEARLLPKVKLEIILNDHKVDEIVEAVLQSAYTGEVGDGKIFILPVEEVVRIRTRERGCDAV